MLFNLTKYGFKAMINDDYKVSMPVYDGILSDEEIIASLSYIKSTWPAAVIEIHDKINDNYQSKIDWASNWLLEKIGTIQGKIKSPTSEGS